MTLGDTSKWLFAPRDAVVGSWYSNKDRHVIQSSLDSDIHTVKWYRRENYAVDPWISLIDHHDTGGSDSVVYGEGSGTDHITSVRDNNGANVYIRYKG